MAGWGGGGGGGGWHQGGTHQNTKNTKWGCIFMFWWVREAIAPTKHKKSAIKGAFSCLADGGGVVLVARVLNDKGKELNSRHTVWKITPQTWAV